MYCIVIFTGFFDSYKWRDVTDICNSSGLQMSIVSEVKRAVLASKEDSTVRNYTYAFDKFVTWCNQFNLSSLPALPVTVALYLVSVIQMNDSFCGRAKLNQIYYAINWAHEIAN